MNNNLLSGSRLKIEISDPWEICDILGPGPFYAKVVKSQEKTLSILLEFDVPFENNNKFYKFFSASIRHHGEELKHLMEGRMITLGFLSLSEAQMQAVDPFDTSWWRGGGLSFIGTAQLVKEAQDRVPRTK